MPEGFKKSYLITTVRGESDIIIKVTFKSISI